MIKQKIDEEICARAGQSQGADQVDRSAYWPHLRPSISLDFNLCNLALQVASRPRQFPHANFFSDNELGSVDFHIKFAQGHWRAEAKHFWGFPAPIAQKANAHDAAKIDQTNAVIKQT
jgi:hypothetical protein